MMGPEGRIGTLWRDWRATRFIRHELNRNWEALRSGSAVIGTNQSNVVLVEFADYQCSFCRAVHPIVDSFLVKHPEVGVGFRHFPLSGIHMRTGDGRAG